MTDNYLDVVQQVRTKYPTIPSREECVLMVNEIAWAVHQRNPEWGISAKTSGTRGRLPNGQEIAEDILHHRTTNVLVDIFGRAGAKDAPSSVPQWLEVPYHNDPSGRPWVKPFDPATFTGASPSPAPTPTPAPPSELALLRDAVEKLTNEVQSLRSEVVRGADASAWLQTAFTKGMPLRIKSFIGKIVGTVGGQ